MCLAVPGRILEIIQQSSLRFGRVEFGGITKEVCLSYLPEVDVDDWVIVHAGFAISHVDEDEAERIFGYLRELGDVMERPEGTNPSDSAPSSAPRDAESTT